MKKTIWGNMLVKNEDRYLWYAVKSVIGYIDRLLIWDTGSQDKTVEIIKILQKEYPRKVNFREMGSVDADGITRLRQQMLKETKGDWLLLVDGDEVWWKEGIQQLVSVINKEDKIDAIISPVITLIGDTRHYQSNDAGKYCLAGRKGHYNIRAVNCKIPGLHVKNRYPLEGYYDKDEDIIQDEKKHNLIILDKPILHFTHLLRSTNESDNKDTAVNRKRKHELGVAVDSSFKYPEVFFVARPGIVLPPWQTMDLPYKVRAIIETPLKKIKRKFF